VTVPGPVATIEVGGRPGTVGRDYRRYEAVNRGPVGGRHPGCLGDEHGPVTRAGTLVKVVLACPAEVIPAEDGIAGHVDATMGDLVEIVDTIWISSLTTIRPSRMALKLSPKSFLLILVVAP